MRAVIEPALRVGFGEREDARALAGLASIRVMPSAIAACTSGCAGIVEMAETGREILRTDEQAVDAVDRGDLLDLRQGRGRFDLHQQADLVVARA